MTRHIVYPTALLASGQWSLYSRLRALKGLEAAPAAIRAGLQTERLRNLLADIASQRTSVRDEIRFPSREELRAMPPEELHVFHRELPLTTKRELQEGRQLVSAPVIRGRKARKTTGGSTGEAVTIVKHSYGVAQERAAMWLAYGWFGVRIGDRCVRMWGVPRGFQKRLRAQFADFGMNRKRLSAFSFDEDTLESYVVEISRFRPDYIHGYASLIDAVAKMRVLRGDIDPPSHIKSVVVTAEVLGSAERDRIERAFDAPVQVEYGCGEVGPIAHECPEGALHVHDQNVIVELVAERDDERPGHGRVVVTDLHNAAMPLVRYDLGDFAAWGGPCSCGRETPVLATVYGRAYDVVRDERGRAYHGEFFMYVFQDLKDAGSAIRQFQVIQIRTDALEVRIVCAPDRLDQERIEVIRVFERALPGFEIRVSRVDEIPRLPSGKMQVVRSHVHPGETSVES